jgi:hypothetical protein
VFNLFPGGIPAIRAEMRCYMREDSGKSSQFRREQSVGVDHFALKLAESRNGGVVEIAKTHIIKDINEFYATYLAINSIEQNATLTLFLLPKNMC